MKRKCQLCDININHKRKGARYCCRQHKEKHYRYINKEKYKLLKSNWQKNNLDKISKSRKIKKQKEIKKYGFTKNYLREYAKRHIKDLRKIKEEQCFKCGTKEDIVIHHEKYTKNPKDWEFICNYCHKKLHNPTSMI